MIKKKWKHGIAQIGIPSFYIEQLPIIPLVNVWYYRNKNATVSSGTSLKTETSKMHQLKPRSKLQLKDKESTPSSLDVA